MATDANLVYVLIHGPDPIGPAPNWALAHSGPGPHWAPLDHWAQGPGESMVWGLLHPADSLHFLRGMRKYAHLWGLLDLAEPLAQCK